ncbi:MAG: hypothetical protein LBR26_00990 [Prevotella sp.]|nr:hypothetical protein [Prevotella sp.]
MKENPYLCAKSLKQSDMAIPIRGGAVLEGKAAEEFYDRWEHSLTNTNVKLPSKETIRDFKKCLANMKKQYGHPIYPANVLRYKTMER